MAKENERTVMGMAEYIDRKALREAFDNADADIVEEYEDGTCDWGFGRQNILEVINSVPAADVAPVRWQPVLGYEGLYEVNQFGQIRNKDGQIMRQRLKKAKYTVYKKVSLYKDGKYKHLYVHRIVAQSFIPNPQGLVLINHKDEDGTNNFVDNLEWCDRSYNATYGTSPKKISKAFKGRESEKRIAVYATNKSGDFAGEWD